MWLSQGKETYINEIDYLYPMQQGPISKQKSIEAKLRSKNRDEFYEAVNKLKRDPHFLKELKRITKELVGVY